LFRAPHEKSEIGVGLGLLEGFGPLRPIVLVEPILDGMPNAVAFKVLGRQIDVRTAEPVTPLDPAPQELLHAIGKLGIFVIASNAGDVRDSCCVPSQSI
jgi:hypothetical protein